VANVSHELKTPMTSIAGYLDGMLDGTIPPEDCEKYMRVVSDEVRRMSRLVRSMLEISRMQSEGLDESKLSRFDAAEAAAQILVSFEQRIRAKNIEVDLQLPEAAAYTVAHRDGITQVIYNLVENAVKFCDDGGTLGLSLEEKGGKLHLSVSNTGATIPEEELPLIFDRFHKLDKSRSKDPDGVGLGLYIVKTILGAHGENIRVESYGGRTSFTFTLPAAR
jgi:signal transduction histidine kinase